MAALEEEVKKPQIAKVAIGQLKRDLRLYPRVQVDFLTVSRFKDAIEAGAKFPPIRVCAETGKIIDGYHRYMAYSELKYEYVDVIGEQVESDADFFLRAVAANKSHGLGYSGGDYEKIVKSARLFKLEREKVALAMAIPVQKLTDLMRSVPQTDTTEPVKIGTQHRERHNRMDARPEPDRMFRTSKPVGYYFFFNQVIAFLKSDACDTSSREILEKLRELEEALQKRVNPEGKQLTPLVLPPPVKDYMVAWAARDKKPLVNLVVEQLTMNVEIDIDSEQCAGNLTEREVEAWTKQLKPYSVINKSTA
jgi:hypothetical protein